MRKIFHEVTNWKRVGKKKQEKSHKKICVAKPPCWLTGSKPFAKGLVSDKRPGSESCVLL
jgi:hypothetical protein